MEKLMVEVEYLIRKIEDCKRMAYEYMRYAEGMDDPVVLAQITQRVFGEQAGYDTIIGLLREMQGSDAE